MDDFLTTSSAAALAGIAVNKLWNYARSGQCEEPRVIGGRAFWAKSEIEKLARRLKAEAKAADKVAA